MATPIMRREILYAKQQSAVGTPSVIAAADAVRCYDVSFGYEGLKSIERMVAGGTMGRVPNIYGGSHGKVGLSFELCGNGGAAAEHAAFFKAAGMVETLDSTASTATYDPTSEETLPLTLILNQDGWRRVLQDCRPSAFSIAGEAGESLRATMEMVGILSAGNDTMASDVDPDYSEKTPIVVNGAVFTINKGNASVISGNVQSFGLDFQLATTVAPDQTAADGFNRPIITDRAVQMTINPEFDLTTDFLQEMRDNSTLSVDILYAAMGTPQNRLRITAPKCSIMGIEDGDRSGLRTRELTLQCGKTGAGDNEVKFVFD